MAKREALSLMDLDVRHELVPITEDQSLRVIGIPAEDIKQLLIRFPPLQTFITGRGMHRDDVAALGPDIIAALCAAATGELGSEEAEKRAARLPVETQVEIIQAMKRVTFSNGFGPFVAAVAGIVLQLYGQAGKAPDTNSPPPSQNLEEQPTPPSGS